MFPLLYLRVNIDWFSIRGVPILEDIFPYYFFNMFTQFECRSWYWLSFPCFVTSSICTQKVEHDTSHLIRETAQSSGYDKVSSVISLAIQNLFWESVELIQ
jgi:hypothetical protein